MARPEVVVASGLIAKVPPVAKFCWGLGAEGDGLVRLHDPDAALDGNGRVVVGVARLHRLDRANARRHDGDRGRGAADRAHVGRDGLVGDREAGARRGSGRELWNVPAGTVGA